MENLENIVEPLKITVLIIVGIAVVFVIIPILFKSSQKSKEVFGEKEFGIKETERAKIVSKHVYSPKGSIEQYNFVIFEKQSGQRIELAIKDDRQFRMMCENDSGTLTHIGNKFISFIR